MLRHCACCAAIAVALQGCSLGPSALRSDRPKYNIAAQRSSSEQLLLNMVRLKYREPASFLVISSISAHFNYSADAGLSMTLPEGAANVFGVSGGGGYAEQPTITYTPLQGGEFATRVMSEIDMNTFILLVRGGWDIDHIMRLTVERIGRLQNRPMIGPDPGEAESSYDRFIELAKVWKRLQDNGRLLFLMTPGEDVTLARSIAPEEVRAADIISADKDGYWYHKGKDGELELRKSGPRSLVIRATYASEKEAEAVDDCLDINPKRKRGGKGRIAETIELVRLSEWHEGEDAPASRAKVPVQLRSFSDVLYYVASGIEVPECHAAKGLVKTYIDADGDVVDRRRFTRDLLDIRCSALRPSNAFVAVHYRGRWFYIDDADVRSKDTFALLGIIFAIQAGEAPSAQPVLTIPVAGG